ncbi:hypothetical protein MPLA_1190082 [Mesorhizobium sp. ORS 3359]|nr:hypothetical protein MPLA_1190082 [Mesorhizobium sp. ORS 3359]
MKEDEEGEPVSAGTYFSKMVPVYLGIAVFLIILLIGIHESSF